MSIKEQIAAMKSQLSALRERIEADDADAISEGEKLAADIAAKEAELNAAEKKANILKALGGTDTTNKNEKETNTMNLKEALKPIIDANIKSNRGTIGVEVKAATDPVTGSTVIETSQRVPEAPAQLRVRDVFMPEPISGNALTYFVMGAVEGTPAVTAEGAKKPQIHPTYTTVTEALAKIPAFFKETDELASDLPYLESVIRGRGIRKVRDAIDAYIVTKLLATSGINTTVNTGISFDNILKAKSAVQSTTGHIADAIIINPTDLETLLLTKDGNQQYMMGGPAYAPYGNGQYGAYLPIWGMRVIASAAVTSGTAIVGSFDSGAATIATKDGEGMRVEVSNSNEDDFVKNMLTVRMEERLLLAVREPAAFAKVYTA